MVGWSMLSEANEQHYVLKCFWRYFKIEMFIIGGKGPKTGKTVGFQIGENKFYRKVSSLSLSNMRNNDVP